MAIVPMLVNRGHVLVFVYIVLVTSFVFGSLIWISGQQKREESTRVGIVYADSLFEFHDFYSEAIVPTLQRLGATFSTAPEPGTAEAPFPGTLVNGVASKIVAKHPGVQLKVYSGFPFPWNNDRVLDDFQNEALQALTERRVAQHVSFFEAEGRHFINVARPSIMSGTCVECHNQYDTGHGKPWKIGDIRGVYQVTMAIANPYGASPSQYLFIAIVTGVSALIGFFIVLPIVRRMAQVLISNTALLEEVRKTNTELQEREFGILEARNLAEHANSAKSQFLSSMSHELRTPLNSILGHAQILQLGSRGTTDADSQLSLKEIVRGGNHLLELIEQLLNLDGIARGEMELSIVEVAPEEILQEMLTVLAPLAASKGVRIDLQLPPDGVPTVLADPLRFKQVLINIIANAIKYNKDDGAVNLTVSSPNAGQIRFVIQDTGQGIPAEKQSNVFKPFDRLGMEAKQVEGTGIGLAICKDLIGLMNGKIGFTSTAGVGTTFWFDLPQSPKATNVSESQIAC